MTKGKIIIILLFLGFVTRFAFFGYPQEVVFDETHFGKFMNGYVTGKYFFDIHPPLAKLMFAAVAYGIGYKAEYPFEKIGEKYTSYEYRWFRLLSSLAGVVLPLVIFFLALELGMRQKFAFLAGLLLVFDNALLAQSRFILLDAFLLLFGFLALLAYLRYLKSRSLALLLCVGICAIAAGLIKWTGLSFLGLIGIHYLLSKSQYSFSYFFKGFIALGIIPLICYVSIFILHFKLLPLSGPGDAYHTPEFQKTLPGSSYTSDQSIQSLPLWKKIIELNKVMYTSQVRMDSTHPDSSKWYEWLVMKKAIFYWQGEQGRGKIYFFGNPVTWYFGVLAVLLVFYELGRRFLIWKHTEVNKNFRFDSGLYILFGGYILNTLPFIGISRVMFLYHYLTALIFSLLIFVYLLDRNHACVRGIPPKPLLFVVVLVFVILSPFTYGIAL